MLVRARLIVYLALFAIGCFSGGDDLRDKEPPPGYPGGLCLAGSQCEEGFVCNSEDDYCYDPEEPCRGFFCGGEDRGECVSDGTFPACTCDPGFNNSQNSLYCCPDDGADPNCG